MTTKHDLLGELAAAHDELAQRAELAELLAELATLPLPLPDQWEAYHHDARTRLSCVARHLREAAEGGAVTILGIVIARVRADVDRGLSYTPDPAALPKQVQPGNHLIVVEGGQP